MEVLIGEKGTGKTRRLIELAFQKGAVLAVANERQRSHIWIKSRELGIPIDVIVYEDVEEVSTTKKNIYIDEMENFVLQMMPFVSGFSITEEKK